MNEIIYLDAAASMLKPSVVVAAENDFLVNKYANAGRGICARASAVDDMVAGARERVARFMNTQAENIVFTFGATDGLNRVVHILTNMPQWAESNVVAVSALEHHSARLPWENCVMAGASRARIVECPLTSGYDYDIKNIPKSDIMVITAMSNVIGRPQDVGAIVRAAREKNPDVITIVDAAQYVAHETIDVAKWDADFVMFSGHKIGADTGIGVMYIKNPSRFLPDKFGGGMVDVVGNGADSVFLPAPHGFEAGTLPLTQIAGLVPAIDWIEQNRPDSNLIKYMYDELSKNPNIKMLTGRDAALVSFVPGDMHVLDFGALMGAHGVCVRVGNMCATWIHRHIGIGGSARISIGPQNTMSDVRRAVEIINGIVK